MEKIRALFVFVSYNAGGDKYAEEQKATGLKLKMDAVQFSANNTKLWGSRKNYY